MDSNKTKDVHKEMKKEILANCNLEMVEASTKTKIQAVIKTASRIAIINKRILGETCLMYVYSFRSYKIAKNRAAAYTI